MYLYIEMYIFSLKKHFTPAKKWATLKWINLKSKTQTQGKKQDIEEFIQFDFGSIKFKTRKNLAM